MKGVFNPSVFVSVWLNRVGCNGRSVIAPEVISMSEIHAQIHSHTTATYSSGAVVSSRFRRVTFFEKEPFATTCKITYIRLGRNKILFQQKSMHLNKRNSCKQQSMYIISIQLMKQTMLWFPPDVYGIWKWSHLIVV